jgi:hypothetical protein
VNDFRPCGACSAYVSAERGCAHWSPPVGPRPLTAAERKARSRARRAAGLGPVTDEERAEAARKRARERADAQNARAAVEEFTRIMNPRHTGMRMDA